MSFVTRNLERIGGSWSFALTYARRRPSPVASCNKIAAGYQDAVVLSPFYPTPKCISTEASPETREQPETEEYNGVRVLTYRPKRRYRGAPKRHHGARAGKKSWSMLAKIEKMKLEPKPEPKDLRTVSTRLKELKVSPWKLNLLAKVVRGLPVVDAQAQMVFSKKGSAPSMLRILKNASNLADIRYNIIPEQLRVSEVFVTKGRTQKNVKFMGRGRMGSMRKKWSHLNLTVQEIDFDMEIATALSESRKAKLRKRKEEVETMARKHRIARGDEDPDGEERPVEASFSDK